ncbi:hypothetical protein ASG93_26490 [Paenibacillus sp. Soil787]|nr:hypothetical protein ASG93_26490 [Paenibacillus sp. Soil787]
MKTCRIGFCDDQAEPEYLISGKMLVSIPKGNYDTLFRPKQGKKHPFQANSGTTFRWSAFYRRKGTNSASTFLSRQGFLDTAQINR